jgi:hypothetical protein
MELQKHETVSEFAMDMEDFIVCATSDDVGEFISQSDGWQSLLLSDRKRNLNN